MADLKIGEAITTPQGNQFRAIMLGNQLVLTSAAVGTVVATGPGVIDFSVSGILGDIGDSLIEVLEKVKGLVSCTPTQTTNITVGSDGKVTSITITSTCVPN